ncbi:MAG: DUF6464 family protein [Cyanobacteria bacterium J06639_1]
MIPRDIAEFFDRLDRATEAFVLAVRDSIDTACDNAIAEFMTFMEGASVGSTESLEVEDWDERAIVDGGSSVTAEDRLIDDARAYHHSFSSFHYSVGDITCRFNALNPELRCAIEPYGPCRCSAYEPRDALETP